MCVYAHVRACACVHKCVHLTNVWEVGEGATPYTRRSEGNSQEWFSLSTMWVPGPELRLSCLTESTFTHSATLMTQAPVFKRFVSHLCVLCACLRAREGEGACRARRRCQPLRLELQADARCLTWVLGTAASATSKSKEPLIH